STYFNRWQGDLAGSYALHSRQNLRKPWGCRVCRLFVAWELFVPLRGAAAPSQRRGPECGSGEPSNYQADLSYQRRTRRARSVFQRLALPTSVSISNGILSG